MLELREVRMAEELDSVKVTGTRLPERRGVITTPVEPCAGQTSEQPNSKGFYTVGYKDNIVILLTGKFEGVPCDLMQQALRIVET